MSSQFEELINAYEFSDYDKGVILSAHRAEVADVLQRLKEKAFHDETHHECVRVELIDAALANYQQEDGE